MSTDNTVIISAILAFLSTTIDDFAVLLMFYGKAANDPVLMANQGFLKVTIGQFIGFTVVVGISLLGAVFPQDYIDLLGLFPIYIGCYKLYELCQELECCSKTDDGPDYEKAGDSSEHEKSEVDIAAKKSEPYQSSDTTDATEKKETEKKRGEGEQDVVEQQEEKESSALAECFHSTFQWLLDPFVLEVTTFALVCSSDNIALYTTLFATMKPVSVIIVIFLFYVLLCVSCLIAICLMKIDHVAESYEKYSKYFIPFFLILLGLFILDESVISPWHKTPTK